MKQKFFVLNIIFFISGLALWGVWYFLNGTAYAANPSSPTQTVTVMAGFDEANIQPVLNEFTNQTGISTTYQQNGDLSNYLRNCTGLGNCPDVAIIPNTGLMKEFANQGSIAPLDPIIPSFDTYYTRTWRELGSTNSTLYGLPIDASSKSMVWYRPQTFDSISATTPVTWTGLLNLADGFVINGPTPFAIGAESGSASGWPLTDIFENILVRVGGPDTHRQLVNHEIAWTDPVVVETMMRFSDIVGPDEYQVGGITGTLTTFFGDAINMVFSEPPTATMYFGASWVSAFIDPSQVPLVDYNYFEFPEIEQEWGKPIIGGADLAILFNDTNESRSLMQYLATPAAAEIWVSSAGSHISPNSGVDFNVYTDPINRAVAEQLADAEDFLYDLDDQLPSDLQVYLWGALMDFVGNQDQMTEILQGIEDQATQIQGAPYKIMLPAIIKD